MAQQNKDTNELIKVRRQKLADLQAAGKNPFEIMKYDVTHHSKEIKDNFEELEGKEVAVAGRLMFKRVMGKASFCNVQDLQGGIQALSRSYFAKIIPPEKSGEYFGRMDICGKGASFLGTIVISLISQVTGKVKYRCRRDIRVLCTWDDRVPDGNHGGKGRRKESEDEIRGRWGILRGEEEIIL